MLTVTPDVRKPKAIAEVVHQIRNYFQWEDYIGVAFPTVVLNGKAMYQSNLDEDWVGIQIDDLLCKRCEKNTFNIINDADAAISLMMD